MERTKEKEEAFLEIHEDSHIDICVQAQNRIANHCLEIIAQITSLRDLKLGNNALSGPLDPSFSSLQNLEILDIHGNAITALPPAMDQLTRLRILNICENAFESLPFATLSRLPLTELLARKNRLTGTLIDDSVTELPSLQTLDVSCNQLQHMVSSGRTVALPALHQLAVSMNRLLELPYVGDWASLLTLTADENSISAIPDGLTKLEKLRHVDFTSNDIRVVPAEIARMENLAMLRLSGNPLRDKKFSNMNTDELKAALAARLEPLPQASPEAEAEDPVLPGASAPFPQATAGDADADQDSPSDQDDFATPPTSAPASPVRSRAHTLAGTPRSSAANQLWPVRQPGGILDRSNTQLSTLDPRVAERVAAENAVREARLSHNAFTSVPSAALSCFAATLTSLSLSHNALAGDSYLPQDPVLELPVLRDLVLASNTITSLTPLLTGLRAPHLNRLDVSFNRLTALPLGLRSPTTFPELEVLLVSNNKLTELEPEAICGLRVVDAANNDIAHLDPRLGLLDGTPGGAADVGVGRGTAGAPGLERLDVMGNRFRVPRWTVLERGTEETLRWLRGRVTVDEMAAWRAAHSGGSDGPGVSAGGGGDGSTGDGMGDRGGGERDDDGTSLADLD